MIPPGIRIFVCPVPVDMRLGFDRLAQLARQRLGQDPLQAGALFLFGGRSPKRIKALWMETHGLCLLSKRLHGAVFEFPIGDGGQPALRIDAVALETLLAGTPRAPKIKRSAKQSFLIDKSIPMS